MDLVLTNPENENEPHRLSLKPDASKKSVFWLELPSTEKGSTNEETVSQSATLSIPGPVQGIVTRLSDAADSSATDTIDTPVFAWGGLQLVSNAKSIELYYIPAPSSTASSPPKETYLTTIKGIPATGTPTPHLFKALCAVPGGPRAVVSVRLKFLSLQPKGVSTLELATLKWTARIAASSNASNAAAVPQKSPVSQSIPPPSLSALMGSLHPNQAVPGMLAAPSPSATPPSPVELLTKDDVGAAMAGMSFALRATEERITAQLQKTITSHQLLQNHVQMLTQQVAQQTQLVHYQTTLIQKQQEVLQGQSELLQSLQNYRQHETEEPDSSFRTGTQPASSSSGDSAATKDDSSIWLQYATLPM